MGEVSTRCQACGKTALVSQSVAVCADCIRDHPNRVTSYVRQAQEASRQPFDLPLAPPRAPGGVTC